MNFDFEDSLEAVGFAIGLILTVALLVTPIFMNAVALRHRTTNSRCALAVIFTFVGCIAAAIGFKLVQQLSPNPMVRVIPGAVALTCVLMSTALAIIGLRQFRRKRRRYKAGSKRAKFALALNVAVVCVAAVGIRAALRPPGPQAAARLAATKAPLEQGNAQAARTSESEFRSRDFGYRVDLGGTAWTRKWETLAKDNVFAEFGAQNGAGDAWFLVIPALIGDDELDLNILTHALAARIGVPFPDPAVYGQKECTQGALEGQAFAINRKAGDVEFVFHLRALRGRGYAYLLAAWGAKRPGAMDFLNAAMDRVTFAGAAPPLPRNFETRNDRERLTQGLVCNDIGLEFEKAGQSVTGLPWFQRGVKFNPRDPALLANAVDIWLKVGLPQRALAQIDATIDQHPGNQKLAAKRARVLLLTGDAIGAEKEFAALLDAGWQDDALFADYMSALCERGQFDDALATIGRYSRGDEKPVLRRMRASVFQIKKDYDRAIEVLLAARKETPADPEMTFALAEVYSSAQRYSDAIAEYAQLIADHVDSAAVFRRKGAAEYALKRYRDAKASFEQAQKKDPANADIKRLVEHVASLLGDGDNSAVRKPIEPVAIPAALLADAPESKAAAAPGEENAIYRRVVRGIEFASGREMKTTEHAVVTVLDRKAVEKFATLDFTFDPAEEEIFVNSLTVKNAQGAVTATGRLEDYYIVGESAADTAPQRKTLLVPVPGLQAGFTLEYTVTRRATAAPDHFPFHTFIFSRSLPVLRSALYIKAARDAVKWESTPGIPEPKRAGDGTTWIVEQPPVLRAEPYPASTDAYLPTVWAGSPATTWAGEARQYLDEIQERLAVDPAVREAAATAAKGLESRAEKTAALARFAQAELAYKPAEFEHRARTPNPAAQILGNRGGDSKDHALLLMQLLEASGIPARLALVHSAGMVRPAIPSLDQFNHMLVFVPAGESGTFIDCTGKTSDLRRPPPTGLATFSALILDREKPRMATIPDYPADASLVTLKREISCPNETDIEVHESVTLAGYSARSVRNSLLGIEPAQRKSTLQRTIVREIPGANLIESKIDGLEDPQSPLHMDLQYTLQGRFKSAAGGLSAPLPAIWERMYLAVEPVEKRTSPFRLWIPTQIESTTILTPPTGWLPVAGSARPIENAFDRATSSARLDGARLIIDIHIARRAGQFPANQYRAFMDAGNAATGFVGQNVVLKKVTK